MSSERIWLLAALCAVAPAAFADVPAPLDRVSLSFGDFYPTVETRVSANGPGITGSDVNFQRDLGLAEHRSLPAFRLDLLVFEHQGFSFGGYTYSKSAGATLNRDIVFDGDEFRVDAFVHAKLTLRTYDAAWRWWFVPDDADVVGIGLGAVYYDLRGSIDGALSINGGSVSARGSAEGNAVAPLATLGWRHAFSERLRGYANFSGVRKPSGTLTGHLLNGSLGLEYAPWRNVAFALEYSANNLDLKAEKASWEGRARIHFYGPAAFVRLRY